LYSWVSGLKEMNEEDGRYHQDSNAMTEQKVYGSVGGIQGILDKALFQRSSIVNVTLRDCKRLKNLVTLI
jgi:hypothetical protein